ncbi:TPA: hypothetical protein HA265_03350 [Candidatus Woesearchaeota archaeon]|nr:hypothetical protein [Candidatus Woesearchaeota archaeon]
MTVYTLNLGVVPLGTAYARDRGQIIDLREQLQKREYLMGWNIGSFTPVLWSSIDQIVESKQGKIRIEIARGWAIGCRDISRPHIRLTDDFFAEIGYESIVNLKRYQKGLEKTKIAGLCGLAFTNGAMLYADFVPEDVFEAIRSYDITHLESVARQEIAEAARSMGNGFQRAV